VCSIIKIDNALKKCELGQTARNILTRYPTSLRLLLKDSRVSSLRHRKPLLHTAMSHADVNHLLGS
jgi:hypothetical protein